MEVIEKKEIIKSSLGIPVLDSRPDRLVCKDLTKIYPTPNGDYTVLSELELHVKQGEFISIIGHSGCGKSTLLSMIASLNDISAGKVLVDDEVVRGAGPDRTVVFQSPSLFPWLTALQNVLIGVKQVFPHASKSQKLDICKYYLSKVGLGKDMNKRASELSQGM